MHYGAHTYGAHKEDQKLKIINQQSPKITFLFNMREGWCIFKSMWGGGGVRAN